MASAPVVQTLDQVMAELAPGAQGQLSNIDKRRGLVATNAEAQKAGLEAAKVKGFNTINNQMTGRGISFGGIAADEQAQYLAEKYLPAVAGVDMSVNERNLGLDNEAAKIQSDMRNQAIGIRESQKKDLNSWNMQEASLAAQAEQNRLNREHEASMTRMKINSEASIAAANRAAQAAQNVSPNIAGIGDFLSSKVGKDGKVHPNTWQKAKIQWMQQGGDPSSFTSAFANYINQDHYWDYTGTK